MAPPPAENGEDLAGLVEVDAAAWLVPFIANIMGGPTSHTPASGLVAALSADEWQVRRAAAVAIRALAIALGPRLDTGQVHLLGCQLL